MAALGAALVLGLPAFASAAPGAVRLEKHTHIGAFAEGAAVLGSRYAYVGTSSSNEMDVAGLPGVAIATRWSLPTLGNGLNYGMDLVALSADNRWLIVANKVRGDVVVIDVTGAQPARSVHLVSPFVNALAVSPDDHLLYVAAGAGIDAYDLASGTHVANFGAPASSAAVGRDGRVWVLGIANHSADIRVYGPMGEGARKLAGWRGQVLAGQNGMIALSPDARRVYTLFDGLRGFDTATGAGHGLVRLPVTPTYNGIAVARNGRQAILWARNFSGVGEVPTGNPRYVRVHFGFIAGGVVPVDLGHMRAISAPSLHGMNTPRQVAYLSNSRYAIVTQIHEVDLIATGTSGRDSAAYPTVSLSQPTGGGSGSPPPSTGGGGGGGPGGGGGTPPGSGPPPCSSWNISGAWTWQNNGAGSGPANGPASLTQNGSTITGTVTDVSGGWTLNGTISGATVKLSMEPPPNKYLVGVENYVGTVTSGGTQIEGSNYGSFTAGHAICTG
jgi:hypothetical protein